MKPQVWADVGGTFTDCFLATPSADANDRRWQRTSTKVLSTGLVRCSANRIDDHRVHLELPDLYRIDEFWKGSELNLLGGNVPKTIGIIDRYDAVEGVATLNQPANLPTTFLAELNANLESPVLAARLLLGLAPNQPLPPLDVRLGTTRGTNALLTRNGARVALVTTQGFQDVLRIGEQDRPDLFAIDIVKPQPLTDVVIEARERLDHEGHVLQTLDEPDLHRALSQLKRDGVDSLAVCLMHAHVNSIHEERIEQIARQVGFVDVSCSHTVAPLIKLVARCETTTLDAYLNPILRSYVGRVWDQFGGKSTCNFLVMTSGGNLVAPADYRGRDSVLSGPAGGVVALGKLAVATKHDAAIGLDMGGTSTDVSRFNGEIGRRYESLVSGVRILTPMMDIHTVAAGGGSICDFRNGRFLVGPQSAGSDPGPACYGRGGPLTVTDANLLLGRIPVDRFPFPLDQAAASTRLAEIRRRYEAASGPELSDEKLLSGFLRIANTNMGEAVRTVSTAQGIDPRSMTLVGFGGAAGQHLCDVSNLLGMECILDHPDASLLSAMGMGMADLGHIRSKGIYRRLTDFDIDELTRIAGDLRRDALGNFADDTDPSTIRSTYEIDCRYLGTDSSIAITWQTETDIADAFLSAHQNLFGYVSADREIEIVAMRCEATLPPGFDALDAGDRSTKHDSVATGSSSRVYVDGDWRDIPRIDRSLVVEGQTLPSPSLIVGEHSTLLVQTGWNGVVGQAGIVELRRSKNHSFDESNVTTKQVADDPILVEVVARRLQGIADAMGEVIRRTSTSVNVKERRDYSCAVFRSDGALVANAPHVPVHLGAMGHTVRHLSSVYPQMKPGDCYVSNDPFAGGSHLPDITLVTPVFCDNDSDDPDFFVASRAHHAEIGGITPGSMPPAATSLAEEGVLIREFALVRNGVEHIDELETILRSGAYPSRNPRENLDDLQAQRAAGRDGAESLQQLASEYSVTTVAACMSRLIGLAGDQLETWINSLPFQTQSFADRLDDDTTIAVKLSKSNSPTRLTIDFTGTAPVHPRGFNATPAIVTAAVMYVLRVASQSNQAASLSDPNAPLADLPLCDGLLRDISIIIPGGNLLCPTPNADPRKCAAVVAGNVETSQRVVDVLLGALGIAAASQGTMNNLLLGDQTFGYYETIGGGSGATATGQGADAVHCHMTNTRITDPEIFETRLPCRLLRFAIRPDSGGVGHHRGGNGITREIEFLRELTVSLITSRRTSAPYGQSGGGPGQPGQNTIERNNEIENLPFATTLSVQAGHRLTLRTPGGGGWGKRDESGNNLGNET